MSAAEKLKALDTQRSRWLEGLDPAQYVGLELVDALPQIMAVIEAAEQLPEFFTTADGRTHSFIPLLDVLDKALS